MVLSKWRLVLYGLIILIGSVIALPSLLSSQQLAAWPDWLPSKQVALGLDLRGGAHLVLEIDERALQKEIEEEGLDANAALARRQSALQQSIEIVRRRIDAIGVAEPTVQALGTDRILVQLPGLQDPASIRTLLGSTAKLTFHRVESWSVPGRGTPRIGTIRVPAADEDIEYILQQRPMLQGERLVQANASFDSQTAQPVVSFRFDDVGAKEFAKITTENVGRQFAIVLDGKVISAPRIQEPIVGGSGQITGNFTAAETSSLSALLRAGALPVPLQIIQEGMVGPDLGSDAIRMGAVTGAAGLLLVLAFMTVLYRGWGVVANLALVVNVFLTLAALTLLGVTLTLPGIAGIVLGIGLAVDANVLINERIREETRNGKSAVAALTNGFQRAYATIIDSNVTALIATALLFWLGSGPVQGFAVTMALGIAISMFTAVAVVKAIMSVWVRWRRPKHFVIGSLLPARWRNATPNFQFMRARFIGLGVSLVLSVASVVLFIKPGLNYGVDFTGGTIIEASAPATMQLADLRAGLERADLGEVSLQQANADGTTILVRIQQQPDAGAAAQTEVAERAKAAILEAEPTASFDRVDIIGPKVSGELTDAGILAVLFASVAMFIYIWIRFDWHFAVGAIATLVLDTTKVIGFFALTGLEFNLTAIAAVLTLIGYSVNDKVVVYDRMRENLRLHPDVPLRQIIDRSINETLARSIFTSVTAFLAMVPMALWGGATVASFAVPMVFGIVVAASSSVFIAAPILLFLGERIKHRPMVVQEATP
ncbi:protein translocase subunit SecDF [Steroidobacter agaridevorans]|uniref:Multifunctional fusion protein n=1 Tax=Steroidobacter agaridevorans TaxID=2695856 RepID=A0A829Y7M3_9GAMM|nr:protein translocase subunit SecD [Steroidobacter agaridevorans]GFE79274.1 protein translocase subunit SecDF [Steroidobacter agaridevorans]